MHDTSFRRDHRMTQGMTPPARPARPRRRRTPSAHCACGESCCATPQTPLVTNAHLRCARVRKSPASRDGRREGQVGHGHGTATAWPWRRSAPAWAGRLSRRGPFGCARLRSPAVAGGARAGDGSCGAVGRSMAASTPPEPHAPRAEGWIHIHNPTGQRPQRRSRGRARGADGDDDGAFAGRLFTFRSGGDAAARSIAAICACRPARRVATLLVNSELDENHH